MQVAIGWGLLIFGGVLYLVQLVSSLNFELAQRFGFQEDPKETDLLLQRAERYTAYWDLVVLGWLPFAGVLMIINHDFWSIVSLAGGAIYLDTSGREAAKNMSFRHEKLKTGSEQQQRIFFASYIMMAVIAIILIAYSVNDLVSKL